MSAFNEVSKVAFGVFVGCVVVVAATQITHGYRTLKHVAKLGIAAHAIKGQFDKIIADNIGKEDWEDLARAEVQALWIKATAAAPQGSYLSQVRDDVMFDLEDAIADANAKAAKPEADPAPAE